MKKQEIDIDVIKNLIKEGFTNQEIANEINIHTSSLRRIMQKNNLTRYNIEYKRITEVDKKQIIELYGEYNCIEIAKRLSIHRATISSILKESGIIITAKNKNIQKTTKERIKKDCAICNEKKCIRRNICESCYTSARRYRLKKKMIEYKGGKCIKC
ncbi:MAG TPA: hypothetical protein VNX68_18035, partial [Nitrosopumilaceae archaeon]|nr:hypothetical protein [Nitrosopumilaceae archaeon]